MSQLPNLPAPFPQLDFPAVEQLRQGIVRAYRGMLAEMEAALAKELDAAVEPLVKSQDAAVQASLQKQERRRLTIMQVLRQLGVPRSAFGDGGKYCNTSDDALRDEAKRLLAQARSSRASVRQAN